MNGREAWRRFKRFVGPQYLVEPPYIEGTLEESRTLIRLLKVSIGRCLRHAEGRHPPVGPGLHRAIRPEIGETDHVDPEGDDEGPAGLPMARERPGTGKHY